jgi:hypothetical protein
MNRARDDDYVEQMAKKAEELAPLFGDEPQSAPRQVTILDHVSRLRNEWAAADPTAEPKQSTYGAWADLWAKGVLFKINLNNGTIWRMRRLGQHERLGRVQNFSGEQLVEALR